MTNEEAINVSTLLHDYHVENAHELKNYRSVIQKLEYETEKDCVKVCGCCYQNTETSDTYRWHDLQKDQDDWPKEHKTVLYAVTDHHGFIRYETVFSGALQRITEFLKDKYGDEVLAWRYIEPLEE